MFRPIVSKMVWERAAALTSRLQSLETEMLAEEENFAGLAKQNRALIRDGGAVEQGSQSSGEDDAAELPSIPVERGARLGAWLSVITYNLGNLWRRMVPPKRIDKRSLASLQQRLVKTGGQLVKHARDCWLLLAEGHLTRRLFGAMLRRIEALPLTTG